MVNPKIIIPLINKSLSVNELDEMLVSCEGELESDDTTRYEKKQLRVLVSLIKKRRLWVTMRSRRLNSRRNERRAVTKVAKASVNHLIIQESLRSAVQAASQVTSRRQETRQATNIDRLPENMQRLAHAIKDGQLGEHIDKLKGLDALENRSYEEKMQLKRRNDEFLDNMAEEI